MTPTPQNRNLDSDTSANSPQTHAPTRAQNDHSAAREHHLDKTIEDSFPASDPPSTDPNPDGDE